ncbi:nucleoside phosphorylase [Phytomonospora sp. NPDC050363]|uniref:nucleoside phosphorylase n=1 Tax=Phytomonospora sp. NPDC050363 TaxID=3155642 RepID=UPI0033E5565D
MNADDSAVNFPGYPGKHTLPPVMKASDRLARVDPSGSLDTLGSVSGAVVVYQRSLFRSIVAASRSLPAEAWPVGSLHVLSLRGRTFAVCGDFGFGAPTAALVVEYLAACGVQRVITVGTAGSLHPECAPGQVIVCTGALRDEGTSYHYTPPDSPALPSPELTASLTAHLRQDVPSLSEGLTWTTDAPQRETLAEVAHYRRKGVLSVEMEASAVFSVASCRGIDAAAAFAVSDLVNGRRWEQFFGSREVRGGLARVFAAASRVLTDPHRSNDTEVLGGSHDGTLPEPLDPGLRNPA